MMAKSFITDCCFMNEENKKKTLQAAVLSFIRDNICLCPYLFK